MIHDMKRTGIAFITLLMLLLLCACGGGAYESGGEGIEIVTTVFPAFDFAREIAGERANVCLLVPPGSETHSFEPTAQDILRIQSCALFVCNGGESEAWVEQILDGIEEEVPTLRMLECVETLEEETKEGMQTARHEHEDHGERREAEYDEHVWTSPVNAAKICAAICERLCAADGANAEYYRERLARYTEKLMQLDAEFRETVENAARRTVIFADRFPVRYFVEEYGLEYFAAFPGCQDDTEPSAKTVAFLIDKVRAEETPAVMYIEFSNEKMADVICEDTGCQKLLFHSCHNVSRDELMNGASYLKLMERNAESLREALG